jgi:hypothetical protein
VVLMWPFPLLVGVQLSHSSREAMCLAAELSDGIENPNI